MTVEGCRFLTVLEVEGVLGGPSTRLCVRQGSVTETIETIVVIEVIGILEWTCGWKMRFYQTYIITVQLAHYEYIEFY